MRGATLRAASMSLLTSRSKVLVEAETAGVTAAVAGSDSRSNSSVTAPVVVGATGEGAEVGGFIQKPQNWGETGVKYQRGSGGGTRRDGNFSESDSSACVPHAPPRAVCDLPRSAAGQIQICRKAAAGSWRCCDGPSSNTSDNLNLPRLPDQACQQANDQYRHIPRLQALPFQTCCCRQFVQLMLVSDGWRMTMPTEDFL